MSSKYPDKSVEELLIEFDEVGYVTHICPDCSDECLPTEVDSSYAYCDNCQISKQFSATL